MNPNQVMPYQYSEPWIRPSLYPGGPHLVNNGVTPQFYCDNTNPVANFMSYPQAVLNPFASVTTTTTNQNVVHPYPRRQALLQIVDPNTGKNILDDILNKPTEDGPIGAAGGGTTSSPASTCSNNGLQGEETRCQAPPPPPQNDEGGLGGTPTPQQMMMIPAQHSVPPWPQDLCQQLQPQQPMPAPESGPPQQQQQPPAPQQPQQQQQQSPQQQQQHQQQQQQQQMLEPVVVQVPVVVYLRDPA